LDDLLPAGDCAVKDPMPSVDGLKVSVFGPSSGLLGVPPVPRVCRSGDVKRVRELLGASQAVFAGFLGVNVNTVRSWEQGKRLPQPIACRFLSEIESDPVYWRGRIGQGAVHIEPGNRPEGGGRGDQPERR
jgi:DNA-binding XRE family transcriptional regulator